MKPSKLSLALFLIRIGIAILFAYWTADKFLNREHAAKVFSAFYMMDLSDNMVLLMGILQAILVLAFAGGLWKTYSYGLIVILHGVSTFSTTKQLLDPFSGNMLFVAGIPVLTAAIALWLLRDQDKFLTINV